MRVLNGPAARTAGFGAVLVGATLGATWGSGAGLGSTLAVVIGVALAVTVVGYANRPRQGP